jgi:hypothetical protein
VCAGAARPAIQGVASATTLLIVAAMPGARLLQERVGHTPPLALGAASGGAGRDDRRGPQVVAGGDAARPQGLRAPAKGAAGARAMGNRAERGAGGRERTRAASAARAAACTAAARAGPPSALPGVPRSPGFGLPSPGLSGRPQAGRLSA